MRKKYSAKLIDKLINAKKNLVEVKSSNSFRKDYKALDNAGLNPTQRAVLTYVYDNMKQSVQRKDFYDKKRHNYYAIVAGQTVADIYNISKDTVGNVLDQLQIIGYIQKVQSWNSGVKVFVRHFICDSAETGNIPESRTENSVSNKNELSNNKSYTVDTSSVSPQDNQSSEQQQSKKSIESIKRKKKFEKQNKLISLKSSLLNSNIPEKVFNTAMQFFNEPKHVHKLFGNLFQAKKSAKMYATKNPHKVFKSMQVEGFVGDKEQVNKAFNFEDNENMVQGLSNEIRHAVYKAKNTANNFGAYFKAVLKKYFLDKAREQVDNYALKMQANEPNKIPMFKI